MSEPNDPVAARLRRLVADAVADAPAAPTPDEITRTARTSPTSSSDRARPGRAWVAGGAIGLVAAAVIALLVVPRGDDDALRPVDTVPPTMSTVTDGDVAEVVPPTTMAPTPSTVAATAPTTVAEPLETVATTMSPPATTEPPMVAEPTVIAAVTAAGDAVLLSADGSVAVELYDGPDPGAPAPEEGPGPNVIDSVALSPDGATAYVGLCCEPIAGAVLSGPPTAIDGEQLLFGYAPAVSPDGRLLAVGQIAGPATALYDVATGQPLDVPSLSEEVGTYSPYDTMWLDGTRVLGLGILSGDEPRWVVVPMVVDGDEVTVGEVLDVDDLLSADAGGADAPPIRFAGTLGGDRFAIHVSGESSATSFDFRMDGVVVDDSVGESGSGLDVGAPARSLWYQPGGRAIWVGDDGVLHRGDETLGGGYLWARPTAATSIEV